MPSKTITVDEATFKALADYASVLGLTAQEYLKRHFGPTNGAAFVDDVDRWLDELTDGLPDLPPLPADFSTKDIYADHD